MLLRVLIVFIAEGPQKLEKALLEAPFCGEVPLYFGDPYFLVPFTIGGAFCCGAHILGPLFCVKAYSIAGAPRYDVFSYPPPPFIYNLLCKTELTVTSVCQSKWKC